MEKPDIKRNYCFKYWGNLRRGYGIIKPKERLTLGDKLTSGDRILLVESTGIHANGLTLARSIADQLQHGYATELSDGSMYGEALLTPTHTMQN